jgi:hypothetical protein
MGQEDTMITATIGSMYYIAGIGVVGGGLSLILRVIGAQALATVVDVALVAVGVMVAIPMIDQLFSALETFGSHLGL